MRKSLFVGAAVAAVVISGAWMSGASPCHIMLDRTAEPAEVIDEGKQLRLYLAALGGRQALDAPAEVVDQALERRQVEQRARGQTGLGAGDDAAHGL